MQYLAHLFGVWDFVHAECKKVYYDVVAAVVYDEDISLEFH